MNSSAKILIIIVTWNKKDYVINLLKSLSSLTFPREQLDILVIDNASTDGTVAALEAQFNDIQIIRNSENLGGTGGFNTGLAWAFKQPDAQYDYLWLLDNDVVVHQNALSELVTILDTSPDIAVAGSTMMQLDYPWRINEMGAFIDQYSGALIFNRHYEEIPMWQGKPIAELLTGNADLSQLLMHCQAEMDVEYVAAASLLIRASVAKQAGLWMDFFIHFDDVEWCLRISKAGHRIAVSAKSLIWHLSAMAKVPNWILYYDNRNILYLLAKHSGELSVQNTTRYILKKTLYYTLIGKADLAELHMQAITDFEHGVTGKKAIDLPYKFEKITEISRVLSDPAIKKIIVPWTINMQTSSLQNIFVSVMKKRPELEVFYIASPLLAPERALPNTISITMPKFILSRYVKYFILRNQFDMALQSDYQSILPLSWVAKKNLFINDEDFCLRPAPLLSEVFALILSLGKKWLKAGK